VVFARRHSPSKEQNILIRSRVKNYGPGVPISCEDSFRGGRGEKGGYGQKNKKAKKRDHRPRGKSQLTTPGGKILDGDDQKKVFFRRRQ